MLLTTTTTPTTPTTASAVATTSTSSTITSHFRQARVDLLLRFDQNLHQITRLLGICKTQ